MSVELTSRKPAGNPQANIQLAMNAIENKAATTSETVARQAIAQIASNGSSLDPNRITLRNVFSWFVDHWRAVALMAGVVAGAALSGGTLVIIFAAVALIAIIIHLIAHARSQVYRRATHLECC
jgi:hypothetical protein